MNISRFVSFILYTVLFMMIFYPFSKKLYSDTFPLPWLDTLPKPWAMVVFGIHSLIFIPWFIYCLFPITIFYGMYFKKYKYTNYQIRFHPVFKQGKWWVIFVLLAVFQLTAYIIHRIFFFENDYLGDLSFIVPTYVCFTIFINQRKHIVNSLPVELMKRVRIKLILPYHDYIKGLIPDDEPHLLVGQEFKASWKKLPRSVVEKETVSLYNENTPGKQALVASITDKGLSDEVKSGAYRLEARLIEIREYAELEIELHLHKT